MCNKYKWDARLWWINVPDWAVSVVVASVTHVSFTFYFFYFSEKFPWRDTTCRGVTQEKVAGQLNIKKKSTLAEFPPPNRAEIC